MAKVFSFTSVLRKNMLDKEKPDMYYALAKSSGEIDIDEMAERIQRSSTVNWADVVCVLRALQTEMIESFKKAEIVRLGDLGSFYVTLRSSGAFIPKDVKEGLIKGARVRFRPGKEIKNALKTLEYSKYKPEGSEADKNGTDKPAETPDPNPGGDNGEAPDPSL
ncbi:HU family DNA-binding protein [uncultured Bacteroides sp.]|jgi:DNA-binding protein, histone-like, putative|uniref:HU family DNA-binding protein n=1 Tax=uncultured Bacteroides sp. TaxID=162156 RepID=UPI002675E736|nr:HU family DNA-binding protein [uncultured Bacteroides sp.]